MPRAAARFTQADVTRALKGAAQAGVTVAVEITLDGNIRIIPTAPAPLPAAAEGDKTMERIRLAKW